MEPLWGAWVEEEGEAQVADGWRGGAASQAREKAKREQKAASRFC